MGKVNNPPPVSNAAAEADSDCGPPDNDDGEGDESIVMGGMTEKELNDERDLNIQVTLIIMATQLKSQHLDKADVARKMAHYERKLRATNHTDNM